MAGSTRELQLSEHTGERLLELATRADCEYAHLNPDFDLPRSKQEAEEYFSYIGKVISVRCLPEGNAQIYRAEQSFTDEKFYHTNFTGHAIGTLSTIHTMAQGNFGHPWNLGTTERRPRQWLAHNVEYGILRPYHPVTLEPQVKIEVFEPR